MSHNGVGMKEKNKLARPILILALGACSFLMLLEPVWWVGLACAAVAIIFAPRLLKNENKSIRTLALIGLILGIAGALVFLVTSRQV